MYYLNLSLYSRLTRRTRVQRNGYIIIAHLSAVKNHAVQQPRLCSRADMFAQENRNYPKLTDSSYLYLRYRVLMRSGVRGPRVLPKWNP